MTSSTRRSRHVAAQLTEIALASPQVVAHRMVRMATAGAQPTARDQKEFHLMGAEKVAAFTESWNAMGLQMLRAQQEMAMSLARACWAPWMGGTLPSMARAAQQMQGATLGVLNQGLTPIRRRAVANAKRLARTR